MGLADLKIEDRLYRYVVGGLDDAEMGRCREETDRLSLPSGQSSSIQQQRKMLLYIRRRINQHTRNCTLSHTCPWVDVHEK